MGGNNGRWWLLNSDDGDLPQLWGLDAMLFLARQDTTIVPEKTPCEREEHVCVPRGPEEEEDGFTFQNGGGIISGSRKRQRIREVWIWRRMEGL